MFAKHVLVNKSTLQPELAHSGDEFPDFGVPEVQEEKSSFGFYLFDKYVMCQCNRISGCCVNTGNPRDRMQPSVMIAD